MKYTIQVEGLDAAAAAKLCSTDDRLEAVTAYTKITRMAKACLSHREIALLEEGKPILSHSPDPEHRPSPKELLEALVALLASPAGKDAIARMAEPDLAPVHTSDARKVYAMEKGSMYEVTVEGPGAEPDTVMVLTKGGLEQVKVGEDVFDTPAEAVKAFFIKRKREVAEEVADATEYLAGVDAAHGYTDHIKVAQAKKFLRDAACFLAGADALEAEMLAQAQEVVEKRETK